MPELHTYLSYEKTSQIKLKIGILGTRGIPNAYGGFEQFAQYLSIGLIEKGHDVWVYNSSEHPFKGKSWNGVNIIHCKDWENRIGTAGQFIYDYNCFSNARKQNFDILLQLGYTSNSIWFWRWPATINIMNMDGLEWKRSKYGAITKKFLKIAEWLGAKKSQFLIADSIGIEQYLLKKYKRKASYIPYGADVVVSTDSSVLSKLKLHANDYYLIIARMEPENNIEMIIQGYIASQQSSPLVIVGSTSNTYGRYLEKTYQQQQIIFIGSIYEMPTINTLRSYAKLYFHGHSVGGTNPSLLEAMAASCYIAAHRNIFNASILNEDASYFTDVDEVASILQNLHKTPDIKAKKARNLEKIKTQYQWNKIIDAYENLFIRAAINK
jgi:glycosyltransferase involved in cell wall biosynthesis